MSLNDQPELYADLIREQVPGLTVATDVRGLNPPGVIVEPSPQRDYTVATAGGFRCTWRVIVLRNAPADRAAARWLNDTADQVVEALSDVLTPVSALPSGYQPDQQGPVFPAIVITLEGLEEWL